MEKLRECKVNGRKGRFHVWENYSDVIPPSNLVGGHTGGVISRVFAIVEFENGKVERCEPYKVVFKDGKEADK